LHTCILSLLISVEAGAKFSPARAEAREPVIMDMWEGDVPWGQLALTALKVSGRGGDGPGGEAGRWCSEGGEGSSVVRRRVSQASVGNEMGLLVLIRRLPFLHDQAYELYFEGRHYIVRDGEVVLIDESTGRLKPITRWQGGLHQVCEVWECCTRDAHEQRLV
jgi:hypothetical protein